MKALDTKGFDLCVNLMDILCNLISKGSGSYVIDQDIQIPSRGTRNKIVHKSVNRNAIVRSVRFINVSLVFPGNLYICLTKLTSNLSFLFMEFYME